MFLEHFWKLGESQRMWLDQLKIAVVQKDLDLLVTLLDDVPTLADAKDIEKGTYLLAEAKKLVSSLQEQTSKSMTQMKKNITFLKSSAAPSISKLDKKF
jgi:hypothetical protein